MRTRAIRIELMASGMGFAIRRRTRRHQEPRQFTVKLSFVSASDRQN